MKRILLITHDFPPSLAGVRRVVKFAKFLPEFGYEPVVLCAAPDGHGPMDWEGLAEVERLGIEVVRTPSMDPYRAAAAVRALVGHARGVIPNRLNRKNESSGRKHRLLSAIEAKRQANAPPQEPRLARAVARAGAAVSRFCLIPDDRRGWVPFAVEAATRLMRNRRFDAMLTSSYPNSAHLVGLKLRRRFSVPWLADFRDGWMQNPYFAKWPTPLHRARNQRLEAAVVRAASAVTTVSDPIAVHLRSLGGQGPVEVIANGYDPDDFAAAEPMKFERFTIAYTGTLFMQRTPEPFFAALRALLQSQPAMEEFIQVVFMSKFKPEHREMIREFGLENVVSNRGMGSYRESLGLQLGADALLILEGEAPHAEIMLTQKVFEYLAAGKPILAIAPQGALARTLWRSGAGAVVGQDNIYAIKQRIEELFNGQFPLNPDAAYIAGFHRRVLAERLAGLLDECARPVR